MYDVLLCFLIRHLDLAAYAVKFEYDCAHSFGIHVSRAQILDDESLSVLDVDTVRLSDGHSFEEYMASKPYKVSVLLSLLYEVLKYLRIESV